MLNNWITRLAAKVVSSSNQTCKSYRHRSRPARSAQAQRIGGQPLEDRVLLANFNPIDLNDGFDANTLRGAIIQANQNGEDDVIQLTAGTYVLDVPIFGGQENASFEGDLDLTEIDRTLTIIGQGADQTFIDQQAIVDRVFQIFDGVTVIFQDLSIIGGRAVDDGTAGANIDNDAAIGGGILISGTGANVSIIDSTVSGNTAGVSGAGVWNQAGSTLTITNSDIVMNAANGNVLGEGGGGIFNNGGIVTITGSNIESNEARGVIGSGGGLLSTSGTVSISDTSIAGNSSVRAGGGIEVRSGTVTINNSVVDGNTAFGGRFLGPGNGGGIHVGGVAGQTTTVNVFNSYVGNNRALADGGGLWNGNDATLNLFNVFIDSNAAGFSVEASFDSGGSGGGIFNDGGFVNVSTMFVSGNTAVDVNTPDEVDGFGGGIFTRDSDDVGAVILGNVTVEGNFATLGGGGIASVDATLAVDNSAVRGNVTTGSQDDANSGNGGGIFVSGTTASVGVTGTDVSGNFAALAGGGIFNQGSNSVAVFGSFVQANFAGALGGGVFNDGGSVFFDFAVVQSNGTSGFGGGIASLAGAVGLNTSFVLGNGAQFGGGIYSNASLFMTGGQLRNNSAQLGGGLFDDVGGAPFLDGVFASGNLPDDIFDI